MAGIADSAVGAILEIPDGLLTKIKSAEDYIESLGETSKRVATDVSAHWSTIATDGLDTFIQKIVEAQRAMQGINGANVNLSVNTQPLENQLNNVSNAAKRTASDVSETVQTLALQNLDFSNISRLSESIMALDGTYKQVEATVKSLERGRSVMATESVEAQATTNMIQLLKEYLELKKKSEEQQKTKNTVFDQNILSEQKTLLQQILQYQKDINSESKRQERLSALGKAIPQEDVDKLKSYKAELDRLVESYNNLRGKIDEMSAAGQNRFNEAEVKADLALARERTSAQEKLNQALQMTSKYTSETKLKSAGISSREEGIYMNEQVAVYRQMIELIKKRGEVEAQVASQGYAQTAAQTNLLQTIQNEYNRLEASLTNVTGKYTEIDRAVKSTFENTKTMQEAENAAKLADALQKAADAAAKKAKTDAKAAQTDLSKDIAEYKRILTLIEQIEKVQRRVNDALASATLPSNLAQQLQSSQAAAEATLNNLYTRRAELEVKRGQELVEIQNQNEAKKGAAAVAEHEKAEKEKTRISRQEATDRYNEEMRQARLQNQALTAQGKQQRMTINDAKERRAIELAQERQKEVDRLRREIDKLDKTDANYQKDLDRLNQRINELLGTTQRRVSYTREEAMAMAKSASTLRQYENAYKALKDAMATTNPKTKDWSEMGVMLKKTKAHIDEIKKKMGEFQGQASKTSTIMGQLQGRIAAAFSIGAISGFIKKMVEVRAQFELQRVALGAILQDKDLADKTFLQIQQMALQSPFSIMQLERATKQIAAFGFESKKLVPTMKMFADISAGLGVEIDRLVLVMGHLKARNFLEGTMVRQFTNMGFNVLGELAKYYSEIEDRMISVGEVQDRVKKKMISFEDVEEVLKRVTSAGGMFYDMQKKQSDSLWGQMQRIKDAYDLMLNDIGKGHQSSISAALTAIRTLISNWRTVWNVTKQVVITAGAYIGTMRLLRIMGVSDISTLVTWWKLAVINVKDFGRSLLSAKTYTNALGVAMKGMMSSTGIGLLVAVFASLGAHLWATKSAAEALQDELNRIGGESVKNVNDSIANFKMLSDTVSDSSKTYNEREEALKELSRVYGEILPKEKLEWDYIIGLNGDYKDLTKTITEYYAAKEYQQKSETILGGEEAKQLQKEVEQFYLARNKEGLFGMMFPESVLRSKAEVVAKEISSGKIANSVDAIGKRIAETLSLDNLDLSKWNTEDYGEIDLHDITQTAGRIADALGGITLASAMAENATMDLSEAFALMDANQLRGSQEGLEKRRDDLEKRIAQKKQALSNLSDSSLADSARNSYMKQLEKLNAEYAVTVSNLDMLYEAQAKLIAQDFKKDVEAELKTLTDVGKKYWDNVQAMRSLELQGRANSNEYKKLAKANEKIVEGNDELEKQFGTKLPFAQLATCQTTHDVKQILDDVAKKAYPTVAKKAIEAMSQANLAVLKGKKGILSFLQDVGNGLKKFLPENVTDWIPDLSGKISKTEKEIAAISGELKVTSDNANDAADSIEKIYSDRAKHYAQTTGADIKKLDAVISKNMTAAETAKALRSEAQKAQQDVDSYTQSSNKEVWLKTHEKTAAEMEQMKQDIEGYKGLAKELDGIEKDSKGKKDKDEITELWKNRLKALQDFYKRYDELRKHFDETESLQRATDAFKGLFDTLDMDMGQVVAKGMSKQGLADNIKSMTEEVRKERPKLVDEFEKAFADTQIQVDFKIKEDSENELKKQLDEMFANYELTEELKKIGVSVDLTYMVGGKPTTLADIRKEIARLRAEGGGNADAENRIKILEEAEKKLIQIEEKNQRTRLKNYVKYLTESMGERAQIEIKALQDINKIREDAELDSFSKEQAVMQRRKKMHEDLSKFDFDQFKGSDVYLSVFKDLERASKEQLQYVLNKLRELQSTFKDLSPVQVKSIANEMKKIEDALADKDSTKNLGANLRDAVKYARKRNDLLKEQVQWQNAVNNSTKKLSDEQVVLEALQLKLHGIQDKSSDEWKEANDAVKRQQIFIQGLQSQIEFYKKKLKEVTGEIDAGESALKGWQKGMANVHAKVMEVKDSLDAVFAGLDSMGLVNDAFRDTWESIGEILGGLDTFMSGLESMDFTKPFSIITGSIKAIGGIFQSIGGIFGIGDKKKERQIQNLVEKVDTLDKAYQRLEKSIEAAYTFDDYNAGYSQMMDNLESQKTAYEEMIRLEEAKKKTDDDKIKEYKEKLQDIADAQDELKKQRIEAMGSTTDYLSEAQSFVDAWLDAYKETGNGLDSLSESWDEFIENLFVKQGAAQIVSARLKKVIDTINAAIDSGATDFNLADAVNKAREQWKSEAENIEPLLEQLFGSYGLGKGTGELILSDLQKGIQNITEPQAAAIEAYLNSMRFAVFRHTEQLDTLIATIQMQYGSGAENPVVTELKGIRGVLDSIDRRLGSVIKSSVGKTYIQVG